MSYSDFKSVEQIRERFDISITSNTSLFENIEPTKVNSAFVERLAENIAVALNMNTEKARSEFIIAPVVLELWRLMKRRISLYFRFRI